MTEDDPEWRVYANLMECLYRESPIRIPVAGTVESIQSITPQVLYDCHRAFYVPGNMVLVCVGDVEMDRVARLAEEILPAEQGTDIPRDYGSEEDGSPYCREKELAMEVAMPLFLGGYKCRPCAGGEELLRRSVIGDVACDVLKVPYHGRYKESSEAFLTACSPKIAFIHDSEDDPADERVLAILAELNAETYCAKDSGLRVVSDGQSVRAERLP